MVDKIPAVILAGGKSSRMREDKSLLEFFEGKTLAQYQYDRLSEIFACVYLSCKNDKFGFTDNLIIEKSREFAPTYGLLEIIDKLEEPFFAIGVDVPFFSQGSIDKLLAAYEEGLDAVVASCNGKFEPLCGIYSPSIKPLIVDSIKKDCHRLGKILKNAQIQVVEMTNEEEFINMNTPDIFKKAKQCLKK